MIILVWILLNRSESRWIYCLKNISSAIYGHCLWSMWRVALDILFWYLDLKLTQHSTLFIPSPILIWSKFYCYRRGKYLSPQLFWDGHMYRLLYIARMTRSLLVIAFCCTVVTFSQAFFSLSKTYCLLYFGNTRFFYTIKRITKV